jgi:hypothetical protein
VQSFELGQVIRDAQLLEREMAIFLFKEHVEDGLRVNVFTVIPIYSVGD